MPLWLQRIKWRFERRKIKLPGWALFLLGCLNPIWKIFTGVPDVFDASKFWWEQVKNMGGVIGWVATIVNSLWFSIGLILLGIVWLRFAGESRHVLRHPVLPYVGWVLVGIVFLAFWSVLVAGYVAEDLLQPKLALGSDPNPMSIVYENKVLPRKASKRARIMVTNAGKKSVDNVKAFVMKVDDVDCRQQLPVSSLDTVFERPNSPPVKGAVTLNPGEEEYFDALVECVAPPCPNGDLVVPHIESGLRRFGICAKYDVVSKPKSLTIRVFGDEAEPVTKTFVISEPGKELLLQPQSGKTAKQDIH